ncbi:MAG: 2-oxoacid:acceptor oxidoreductase subunit alpha [bacterium]|nr:2-oxoacid:acceptor oxidoreductase subunit alpha [bacterium]
MAKEKKFLSGNEECGEAAVMAGVRFYAGYPITPSTEIAEYLALRLPQVGGIFIQMEDEIASMAAVIGASLAGLKSMTATSGPGFSLKQEHIGYASLCEIPCIIVNVQRGGPSTGLPTLPAQADVMQARWGTHGDHPIIVVSPASVKEMFFLTIQAINFSEKYRVPVIILSDEVVAHTREILEIPDISELEIINRPLAPLGLESYLPFQADPTTDIPPMAHFGSGYRFNVTGLMHTESGFPTTNPDKTMALLTRLHRKLEKAKPEITLINTYALNDAQYALVTFGSTTRSALRAVKDARSQGIPVGLMQLVTLWPFPEEIILEIANQVDWILVPEMNLGQIVFEVERAVHGKCDVIKYSQANGELFTPKKILDRIKNIISQQSLLSSQRTDADCQKL